MRTRNRTFMVTRAFGAPEAGLHRTRWWLYEKVRSLPGSIWVRVGTYEGVLMYTFMDNMRGRFPSMGPFTTTNGNRSSTHTACGARSYSQVDLTKVTTYRLHKNNIEETLI